MPFARSDSIVKALVILIVVGSLMIWAASGLDGSIPMQPSGYSFLKANQSAWSTLFSHSRSMTAEHARQMYGNRLEFFRRIRRQLDPQGRLLNPFLAQYFD